MKDNVTMKFGERVAERQTGIVTRTHVVINSNMFPSF